MTQQRELQKQHCIGALGVSAVVGLPQLFVQPTGAPSRGGSLAASSAPGAATRAPEVQHPATRLEGTAPVIGLGLVGASALVARAARSGRSSRTAQVARQFFGGGGSGSSYYAFDPANEAGVQDPVGFWDPLGLSDDKDEATFKRRRAVEIKHGRVCMYATIGYIVPEYYKFPGFLSPSQGLQFSDVPNGLGALSKVPLAGWLQILFFAGAIETSGFFSGSSVPIGFMRDSTQDGTPGDYGIGFPNFIGTVDDPEAKKSKLAAELANGRLAMVAIIGMFFQDGLTGSAWGDWALYTDSPLRAFEGELGIQPPFGFWDPMGMSSDGDVETFKRRRATELKHGRVSMLACLGYITPEYFKFPGYCAPSSGLTFADIPNGLAAFSKVPGFGWVQMIAFVGAMEKGFLKHDPARAPGDFANAGVLGVPNGKVTSKGEGRTRKLNAELANGRLAMMAIIGMFYQDGLTGSAWGDWALYTDSPLRATV